jgi:DNA-binding HxlR family transcriptional regulator
MQRTSFAQMQCSLARGLELIGDWWSPLIIRDLYLNVIRFDDLVADLGISRNLLARRLKALTEHGVIERREYQKRPRRYEYRLTRAGLELVPAIVALTVWGDRWARPKEGSPLHFVHTTCGKRFSPRVTCSACGGTVSAGNVKAVPGPGARARRGTAVLAERLSTKS